MNPINSKIADVTYRTWQNENDYSIFTDLINAYNQKIGIDRLYDPLDYQKGVEIIDGYQPSKMFFIAEMKGLPICVQNFFVEKETDGPYAFFHQIAVHPQWIAHPVVCELFDIVEKQILQHSHAIDQKYGVKVVCRYEDKEEWLSKMLVEKGFSPARYFYQMKRSIQDSIPSRQLPQGLEIKPVDTQEKLLKAMWANDEAFKDHWAHIPLTEKAIESWQQTSTFDPSLWKVAWDGDKVAGGVLNFVDQKENEIFSRKRGYTEEITTQRAYRGKGVASALIATSIQMFKDMGMEETALSVDTENPSGALGLYQSFGYQPYKQKVAMEKQIR
jgi:ribosomal protein S18 acetylase RimI-like enzyme